MSMPPPSQPPRNTGLIVGLAFAGAFGYWVVNVVVGITVLNIGSPTWIGAGAVFLALLAIGGGIGLQALRQDWSRGLGLGLMIGWSLASIVSAGFCTGLNPALYS
ncbi:hypothetical protein [Nonomuraea sp. NPDC048916]|uniref:hypothetical protein n=1 Tax=Nonomuraea sp. NPDC048916 TaxID=3154232 RepID=UPI0033CD38C7